MDCREKGQRNKEKKEADEERRRINRNSALAFAFTGKRYVF
jgi:hypothetical protein